MKVESFRAFLFARSSPNGYVKYHSNPNGRLYPCEHDSKISIHVNF